METNTYRSIEPRIGDRFVDYAPVWQRIGAYFVDALFVWVLSAMLITVNETGFDGDYRSMSIAFVFMFSYLYYPLMEGAYGATLGKMAFGFWVVDKNAQKIGFDKAFLRHIFRLLYACLLLVFGLNLVPEVPSLVGSGIVTAILMIDFFAYTNSLAHQSLHDTIAGTFVVTKESVVKQRQSLELLDDDESSKQSA